MIGNDPIAHKLQDEDEESGGQSKHANLQPQRLHFEIFYCDLASVLVNHYRSVITKMLCSVNHNVKLLNVGL